MTEITWRADWPSCLLLAGLIGCGGAAKPPQTPSAALEPSQVVRKRLLHGPDRMQIAIVELEGGEALMRVEGARELLDGKVLRAEMKGRRRSANTSTSSYSAQIRGRPVVLLYSAVHRGGHVKWRYSGLMHHGARALHLTENMEQKARAAIDPRALQREHQRQLAAGELAFQRFDRAWWIKKLHADVAKASASLRRVCGGGPRATIDFSSVSDTQLRQQHGGLSRVCRWAHTSLKRLCRGLEGQGKEAVKALVKGLSAIRCEPGKELGVQLKGKTLWIGGHLRRKKQRFVPLDLKKMELSAGRSLADAMVTGASDICIQGDHRALIGPLQHKNTIELAYGKGSRFVHHGRLGRTNKRPYQWARFFDPRHVEVLPGGLGWAASIAVDRQAKRCTLRCGSREKKLALADRKTVESTLRAAKYVPSPLKRRPHALGRDRRGTYYYVDRGRGAKGKGDFRVFIGRRGRLRPQKMVDVVSDSEGQIFETKRGKLRLIFDKSAGLWIEKRRERKLVLVPIKKNLPLIYRELGVYWGKRLGTPCDDF